jgi:hypothetical protein
MRAVDDPVLGPVRLDRFFWECEHAVPFLGATLLFMIDPEERSGPLTDKQRQVFLSILELPAAARARMAHPIYANYVKRRGAVEADDMPAIANVDDVWRYVEPRHILIPRHRASPYSYFFVALECAWEPEHGLEVLFRDGSVLHASQQEGLGTNAAWYASYLNE